METLTEHKISLMFIQLCELIRSSTFHLFIVSQTPRHGPNEKKTMGDV